MTRFSSAHPNLANGPKAQVPSGSFDPSKTALITDLDGCLVNMWGVLQTYLWDTFRVWAPPNVNRCFNVGKGILEVMRPHGFEDHVALNKCLWGAVWGVGTQYYSAHPYYGYWQALLKWKAQATEPIRYLTARPQHLLDHTRGWLDRWGLGVLPPNLVLEDDSSDKLRHLRHWAQTKEVVYVDDKVATILEVARAKIPNVKLVLFAQPWNAADSPDWKANEFVLEGKPAPEHPEFDLFLHHGFDLGFRRLTESQISEAILAGLD